MRFLWSASPLRAVAEALILEIVLLALVLASIAQDAFIGFVFGWMGVVCVVLCALRARLPEGRRVRVLGREVGLTLLLAVALQGELLLLAGKPLEALAANGGTVSSYLWVSVPTILFFIPLRLAALLWRLWNITRRKRLLWSIVHAHLLTVLVVVVVLMLGQAIQAAGLSSAAPLSANASASTNFVAFLLTTITPVFLLMIVAIPFILVVMALAGVVSYFIARQMTRRIEVLTQLTGSLRSGNYSARIPVEGEDEIAQLQTDFNAMAADLENTLLALKTERDTVTGLLQTRRELMAGVSHELRTPVATVRGYLDSALRQWGDAPPPTLRHDLEVMEHELIRLQGLIDDLFTLSRADVGRLTLRCVPTEIMPLIRRVVETAEPLAWQSGRVRVVAELPPQLSHALADAGRLEQVLHNLIHNSLRHTPPGGIVAVVARNETEWVIIEVRDTGEGIPADELPHIWERFYRGSRAEAHESNAGLGLALVKELTEAMGGTVTVESTAGQGSRFTVRLPSTEG